MSVIDRPDVQADERPYYARRDASGHYTYRGRPIKSVTTYLGYAPGQHLIPWAGKQAIMEACSFLVRAGVKCEDPDLEEYCRGVAHQRIGLDHAHSEIMAWRVRMLAHERYRDHKARIGSLAHHFVYASAFDLVPVDIVRSERETLDWLWHETIQLRLFEKKSDPDWTPNEEAIDGLCASAYAYVLSAAEWIEKARPRWTMVGQEAMVVRRGVGPGDPDFEAFLAKRAGLTLKQFDSLPEAVANLVLQSMLVEYAGTVDAHFELVREDYARHFPWVEEWPEKAVTLWGDFKTSNSINHQAVQAQVSAYRGADTIVLTATGEEHDLPESDLIASLHIGPHESGLGISDEFGTLESKTKQVGTKLYTYPNSPLPLEGFCGLVRWADYADAVPRAHQQVRRPAAPKTTKFDVRPAPFG